MLPDLSENLSNEERTWEEIMQIKAMPVCMSQKMQLKNQLQVLRGIIPRCLKKHCARRRKLIRSRLRFQSATKLRLQGFEQLKWRRRKAWQQFRTRMKEAYSKMELWNDSLKKIGGNFGMGIVAYFLFIKWLMYLNLLLFAIILLLIVLPATLLEMPEGEACAPNSTASSVACCSELYRNLTAHSNSIIDIVQGGGILEYTLLFYGSYTHRIYESVDAAFHYDSPLSYVCAIISVFIVSLVAIVRSAAKGFKERVVESEGQFYQYCNLVFGGWDYCIQNERSAAVKHKALYNEMKGFLEAERMEEERQNRTREEKTKLMFIRLFVNLLVLTVLGACGVFIYYIIDFSFDQLARESDNTQIVRLFFEFLPYICIVGLNVAIPFLFRYLVALEGYSPSYVVRVTLFRTVFLRLASLVVLLTSLYRLVAGEIPDNECANSKNGQPLCWETFVGRQFFKLYATDLFIQFFMTFFVNFPRSLIARHTENKVLRFVGEQEFDLPKHVLDIVYSQTICWLGCFYAPLLPMVAVIGTFLLFYVKKFTCLVNSTPSSKIYRASRSNSLFMFILLVSFILATVPVGYSIAEIMPSKSCGPFRDLRSVWTLLIATFSLFPNWLQSTLFFLGTAGFGIPAFVVLALLLYYYYAVSIANKHMVTVLKNQLVLEGHDKQFLLNRLSAFIKQQQDQNKFHQEQTTELGTFQHV